MASSYASTELAAVDPGGGGDRLLEGIVHVALRQKARGGITITASV